MELFIIIRELECPKKDNINECLFGVGKINGETNLTLRRSGCAALDMAYVASW